MFACNEGYWQNIFFHWNNFDYNKAIFDKSPEETLKTEQK